MTQQSGEQQGGEHALRTPGSASNLAVHFKGMDFPANKADLLRHAQQNNAPQDVQNMINSLPERQYNSMADVMAAWGKEHR